MAYWIEQILDGLGLVGPILLIAVSLTVTLQAVRALNVAIGATIVLAQIVGIALSNTIGVAGMIVGCVGVSVAVVVLTELFVLAPQRKRVHDVELSAFAATLGVSIVITAAAALVTNFQDTALPVNMLRIFNVYTVGGVHIVLLPMIIFVVAVVATITWEILQAVTPMGKLFRAMASDQNLAVAAGVPIRWVALQSAVMSGFLAGIAAGLILVQTRDVTAASAAGYLITPFVAVVLGGLGSLRGTVVAALFLGVAQALIGTQVTRPAMRDAIIFGSLLVVLLVRPSGFAGRTATARDY